MRTWSRDGQILAVGLLDEPELLRLTIASDAARDEDLAQQLVDDVTEPERSALIAGKVSVEAPKGALVQDLLLADGWTADEPWTPLRRAVLVDDLQRQTWRDAWRETLTTIDAITSADRPLRPTARSGVAYDEDDETREAHAPASPQQP